MRAVKGMKRSSTDSQWQQLKCPVKRSRQPQSLFHCFRILSGWTAPKCRQYISIPARTSIRSVVPAQQISKGQVSNKNAATHTHTKKHIQVVCAVIMLMTRQHFLSSIRFSCRIGVYHSIVSSICSCQHAYFHLAPRKTKAKPTQPMPNQWQLRHLAASVRYPFRKMYYQVFSRRL